MESPLASLREGDRLTISAVPNHSFEFDKWTSNNGGDFENDNEATTIFTMPGNDTVITAIFKPSENSSAKYSLKIEAAEGGTIPAGMADVINGEYAKGFEIKILAREMPSHYFTHWTSSGGGVFTDAKNSSTIFAMPGNDTVITAHFSESPSK